VYRVDLKSDVLQWFSYNQCKIPNVLTFYTCFMYSQCTLDGEESYMTKDENESKQTKLCQTEEEGGGLL